MPKLLPDVAKCVEVDESALDEVHMGAFKITVDKGQGVRVAAIEALGAAVARVTLGSMEVRGERTPWR